MLYRSSLRSKPQPAQRFSRLALCLQLGCAGLVALPLGYTSIAQAETAPQASTALMQFNIPAGPLAEVLNRFAADADIFISGQGELTQGKQSPGLHGQYSLDQGLQQILDGTGIRSVRSGNTVTLTNDEVMTLSPVQVDGTGLKPEGSAENAYRVKSTSLGALGTTDLQNTPYSVEVYSREYMDNQQARSLSVMAKYDASINIGVGDLTHENNTFLIRGIRPDFDTGQKLDGLNFRSRAMDLPLEHMERVEILKGAGGFLYGFGQPGGVVNYVSKRPTEQLTRSISTQLTDDGLFLLHGDIGDRIGKNDQFGYRINLVHQEGDTYINDGKSRRESGSIALDWQITPDLIWQVDALQAERKSDGGYNGLVTNTDGAVNNYTRGKPLDPIDGDKRLAPAWGFYESEHKTYGSDLIWQCHDNWDIKLSHRNASSYRYSYAPWLFANENGDYSAAQWNANNLFDSQQTQAVVTGKLETGFVKHSLTAGFSHTMTSSSRGGRGSPGYSFTSFSNVGNLVNPVEFSNAGIVKRSKGDADFQEYSHIKRREFFLSDALNIGENWDLIIGLRHGTLDSKYGEYKESETTPTLALIHRPIEWMSLYASYVEAFEEGATAPETAVNAFEVFDPLVSKQYELGVKINKANWSANMALFELERGLTYTDSNNVFSQDGEARYRGVELSGKANFGEHWLLGASAMWLDATSEKTTGGALDGKPIESVARKQLRLYSEYSVPSSTLVLTGGLQYTGKRPVDNAGQWYVDGITLFDLGARYKLNINRQLVTLRLNIENLTDEAYWVTERSGDLQQGAPRTVKLGMQVDF
ncbi:hypothetical protein A9Q89_05495 [Gammaproteobacteria bacterium 53_120_T64]|nr:hypothetical protein A9Q89_05495 [Gammaproteobacteria bacterium 53_120_T64]